MDFSPRNLYLPGGKIIVPGGGMGVDAGISPGPSGGASGPTPDMRYDPQWIVDNFGMSTAQDGVDLNDSTNLFGSSVQGAWYSTGALAQHLEGYTSSGINGVTTINHADANIGNKPTLLFVSTALLGTWCHPNRQAGHAVATESLFHPATFTYFFVACRRSAGPTTTTMSLAGTRNTSGSQGWFLNFRESGGTRTVALNWANGSGTARGMLGKVWSTTSDTWFILAIQHDGTNIKLWCNEYFASPDGSVAEGYTPRSSTSTDHLDTFQLGSDGQQGVLTNVRVADVLLFNSVLSEADFNATCDDLSAKFGIAMN